MAEDEVRIRELYAESAAAPRADHPDEAVWEAMALGELSTPRREALFDHVSRCAECATVYRGLRMLAAEAAEFDPAVPQSRPRRVLGWPATWVYGGLVAAAAAVLVVALIPPSPPGLSPVAPAASADPLRSGEKAAPVPLEPTGTRTAPPTVFRWQGIPGAARYRVELSNRTGDLLWSSAEVAGTTVDWPSSVPAAPGVYHWQVIAVPDADRPLAAPAVSAIVSFEVVGSQ